MADTPGMIMLDLTDDQKRKMARFFDAVVASNISGDGDCAIGAQIYRDGMVVRLFSGKEAAALANALGGGSYHSSADERMRVWGENNDG